MGEAVTDRWSHLFVGRDAELQRLKDAWFAAKVGKPQVLALVAESGYGKTRLAQELFNWLSVTEDSQGADGYWPDRLLKTADNLQLNPDILESTGNVRAMPFLWWGLRATNPEGRNNVVSSAIRIGEEYLRAHLAVYSRAVQIAELRAKQLKSGGLNVADLALNTLPMALPVVGTIFALIGTGKTAIQMGIEVNSLESEIRALKSNSAAPEDVARAARIDLVDLIIQDLRRVAFDPPKGFDAIPVVLLLDDLQWSNKDPALRALIQKLLEAAGREGWPLMVLATCWEQEWHFDGDHNLRGLFNAAGVEQHSLLLGRTQNLDVIARAALPGLSADQVRLLVGRADGNPRFLDELIKRLILSPRYFVGRDVALALTSDGEALVAAETFEGAILHRLQASPAYVQMALGLASLQGVRFSPGVVTATANHIGSIDVERGLVEGERPYAFTSQTTSDASEFRALAYHLIAKSNLSNIVDIDAAENALRKGIANLASRGEDLADRSVDVLEAQLELFDSDEKNERDAAFKALSRLIDMAALRHDLRTAGRLAELWAEKWNNGLEASADDKDLRIAFNALMAIDNPRAALSVIDSHLSSARAALASEPTRFARERLVSAMLCTADAKRELEGSLVARPMYEEILQIQRDLDRGESTEHSRYMLRTALARLADAICATEGDSAALPVYLEALPLAMDSSDPVYAYPTRRSLGVLLQRISTGYFAAGDMPNSKDYAQRSLVLHQELEASTHAIESRRDVSVLELALGKIAYCQNDVATAFRHYDRAREIRALLWSELGVPRSIRDYDDVLRTFSAALVEHKEWARAEVVLTEKVSFYKGLLITSPTPRSVTVHVSTGLRDLAQVVKELSGPRIALPYYLEAINLSDELKRADPTPMALFESWLNLRDYARARWRAGHVFKAIWAWVSYRREVHRLVSTLMAMGWDIVRIRAACAAGELPPEDLPTTAPSALNGGVAATRSAPIKDQAGKLDEQVGHGHAPSGAVQEAQSRNAPCTCGSGKRFKHCHGAF